MVAAQFLFAADADPLRVAVRIKRDMRRRRLHPLAQNPAQLVVEGYPASNLYLLDDALAIEDRRGSVLRLFPFFLGDAEALPRKLNIPIHARDQSVDPVFDRNIRLSRPPDLLSRFPADHRQVELVLLPEFP